MSAAAIGPAEPGRADVGLRFDANLKWLFTEVPFERRCAAAAEHGFAAVEIAAPYSHSIKALRRWLADAGVCLVLINSPGGGPGSPTAYGSACHPAAIAEFRAGAQLALEYATALEAPFVHLMAGVAPGEVPYETAYLTYLENLAWSAEQAAQAGVTLLVEVINQRDVPGFVLRSLGQAAAAIEAVGSPRVRLLFDIYHCQVNEGDVTTRWRELARLASHIQLADAPDRSEPGTGELNWDHLLGEVGGSGYDGWIGCEYRPTRDTASSLAWRQRYDRAAPLASRP
jgi:hydroxypyruvate isomerase